MAGMPLVGSPSVAGRQWRRWKLERRVQAAVAAGEDVVVACRGELRATRLRRCDDHDAVWCGDTRLAVSLTCVGLINERDLLRETP
jgi:hypothetical protein